MLPDTPPRDTAATPYAGLTPEAVLDALDAVGLRGDGRLLQLNSYENRVFQVFLEDGRVVVPKFYRPGRWSDAQILEEHAFSLELAAAEIPVVAPLALRPEPGARLEARVVGDPGTLAHLDSPAGTRLAVMPRRAGQAPELDRDATLEWIGRFLGRIHAVGRTRAFAHRRAITPETYGRASRDWLARHEALPDDARASWFDAADRALDAAARAFDACADTAQLRLHGDCHPGNLLWTAEGPHFVDLDDAVNGPAVQDLWMLLSGERASMARQLRALLAGYEQFSDFDRRELRLIEPLRTLRMIHHSAWIAQRWADPAFPVAFPWFAGSAYWQQQAIQLREQVEAMAEPPLSRAD